MIFENEKQLLKIIKYTPSIFIIVVSIMILAFEVIDKNTNFEHEKERIQNEYTQKNKNMIKMRVHETYNFIKREQETTEVELRQSLENAVTNAYNISKNIYEKNKFKSKNEIKNLIKEALREIRFNNGRGYFFIYEKTGKNVLLPHNSEFEGKNFWKHKDAKGAYIIQDMTKLLRNNTSSFYEWYWYNPTNPGKQRKKIGLVRNFEPFNWIIGTGEYVEDFQKEVQEMKFTKIYR